MSASSSDEKERSTQSLGSVQYEVCFGGKKVPQKKKRVYFISTYSFRKSHKGPKYIEIIYLSVIILCFDICIYFAGSLFNSISTV